MTKRIIAALAALLVLATPQTVLAGRVIYGEFQTVGNVTPPTRLDILMYRGTIDGLTYWQRCANMGGYIVFETWWGRSEPVCRDVDY